MIVKVVTHGTWYLVLRVTWHDNPQPSPPTQKKTKQKLLTLQLSSAPGSPYRALTQSPQKDSPPQVPLGLYPESLEFLRPPAPLLQSTTKLSQGFNAPESTFVYSKSLEFLGFPGSPPPSPVKHPTSNQISWTQGQHYGPGSSKSLRMVDRVTPPPPRLSLQ